MRPLTAFASYHDNTGRLLVGRVRFCTLDSSPAEVFASDGTTSLGSSVFTDSSGRLVQQPFLADHDYLLFFDKYVGHATMTEDDDSDSWEEQGSAIDAYDVFGVSVECGTVVSVATIETLRSTEPETVTPFGGLYMVDLLGYDEAGDKPVIRYVWDPENSESDDGGSVIAVEGVETGRWVIKDRPEYVDSRHFGAFPSATAQSYATQRYNLQRAALWAHSNGLGLYLYASDTEVYYDISGLNIYNLKCAPGASVFTIDGSTSNIIGIESVTVHSGTDINGTTVLSGNTVRTSWAGNSSHTRLSPSERLIIDSNINSVPALRSWNGITVDMYDSSNASVSFSDCTVYVHATMDPEKNVSFDSCAFVSPGMMDGHLTFVDCFIPADVFVDDFDASNSSFTGCSVASADEWGDIGDWLSVKISNGDWEYDFCGRGSTDMIIGKPSGSTGTLVLKNAKDVVLKASGTIPVVELQDCSGTTISTFPSTSKLVVRGGSIDGTVTLNDEVYFENANVYGDFTVYSTFGADGCAFSSTSSVAADTLRLSNCRSDAGASFAERGLPETGTPAGTGSAYDNCSIGGSVSGFRTIIRNSSVAVLTVYGMGRYETTGMWVSVIENSSVADMRLQVWFNTKPMFTWKNSSITITQYGAQFDVSTYYVREWTCENCDVRFGNRRFYGRSTFFKSPILAGDYKLVPSNATQITGDRYVCVKLSDLLLFENFYRFSESTVGLFNNYFGYSARVMVDSVYDNEQHFMAYIGKVVNVDGELCLFLGMDTSKIEVGETDDQLYLDFDILF